MTPEAIRINGGFVPISSIDCLIRKDDEVCEDVYWQIRTVGQYYFDIRDSEAEAIMNKFAVIPVEDEPLFAIATEEP